MGHRGHVLLNLPESIHAAFALDLLPTIELSTQVERYGIRDDIHNQIRMHVP
jgi:hypothetical protein